MKISVALPVYNGANYLKEALDSLLHQGAELDEVVISDNCSTDATASIVLEYALRDSRIKHCRSESFLNQADNISRSIQLCRNEWVQMLCHDDLLRPGAIAALAKLTDDMSGQDCALIFHQPCHLFSDNHTYRHIDGVGTVERRLDCMNTAVIAKPQHTEGIAGLTLGNALKKGTMPYLPAITTGAVRRSVFAALGGFDSRWVHFDVFLWIRLAQSYGFLEVKDHWTLTRVHSQQVAIISRQNQRSYRDFRDFYATFSEEARVLYGLSLFAYLKLRLKPVSQASAPLVVALHKQEGTKFFAQLFALPVHLWPIVLGLTAINYFKERRRLAPLWKIVPAKLTYE